MHGPEPVGWMLVALCGGVGASCLWRLRDGPSGRRRAAAGEALMGFGMAAMAVPASAVEPLPPRVFVALFGVAAGYELVLAARGSGHRSHHLHHVVGALAMVHMALVMAASPSGGAHGHHGTASVAGAVPTGAVPTGAVPTGAVTAVLSAYFAVYVLRAGARLVPAAVPAAGAPTAGGSVAPPAGGTPWLPEVTAACRLSMGMGMLAMLLTV